MGISVEAAQADPAVAGRGRVLFVGSSGGHLSQMASIARLWELDARAWVTFDTPDAVSLLEGERVWWAYRPTTRNVPNMMRNAALAVRVLRQHRADVVVSTGAGVAFPFFVLAWFMRIHTVYVEVFDRIETPTLTGRLCQPISSVFCVQWDRQKAMYPQATMVGPLL